jgi:hypothetical protein
MPRKRILVASPVEPSGGSWLLNCFLELGVKVGHKPFVDNVWRGSHPPLPADHIWQEADGGYRLNPKAAMIVKFLPGAGRRSRFAFRDDVELEYVQDFAHSTFDGRPLMLIVRDPRDSIYSMYRRVAPELSFEAFYRFPDPVTLLDRAARWALFVAGWLDHPQVQVVRFEDYKRDDEATLRAALAPFDLGFTDAEIEQALAASSFEKAREAEAAYRERFPDDRQTANRAGKVGEGRSRPEVQALIPEIERAAGSVLRRLGYAVGEGQASDTSAARVNRQFLAVFRKIRLPEEFAAPMPDIEAADRHLLALLSFANRLDEDVIRRAGLAPDEARQLVDSLSEFSGSYRDWLAGRMAKAREKCSDGSDYFFRRIKDLRKTRVASGEPGQTP